MARNLRWQLCFKSLKNADCHIDIYQEGYTGTTVTQLTGAESPFVYEEDDDTNLLSFIRVKTAYLRVIETEFGELNELSPDTSMKHFVKAYYGGTVNKNTTTGVWSDGRCVFVGYMQAAEYSNDWTASPREMEYAITSPLGLLNDLTFSTSVDQGQATLGSILKQVIDGLNADYTRVVYYSNESFGQECTSYPWSEKMFYSILCPFNSEYRHNEPESNLFAPQTYKYFIEGVCACFGWILHEMGDTLYFTKIDSTDNDYYAYIYVDHLETLDGYGEYNKSGGPLGNNIASDQNKQTKVYPLKSLTQQMEGEIAEPELNCDKTKVPSDWHIYNNAYVVAIPLQNLASDVDGAGIGVATIYNNAITNYGLFPVAYANKLNGNSLNVQPYWFTRYNSNLSGNLITWKYNGVITGSEYILLKMEIEIGTTLTDLAASGTVSFYMHIKKGNRYYDFANKYWRQDPRGTVITFVDGKVVPNELITNVTGNVDDTDGLLIKMTYHNYPSEGAPFTNDTIEIGISTFDTLGDGTLIKWSRIQITDPCKLMEGYVEDFYRLKERKLENPYGKGIGEDSITVNFQNYDYYRCSHSFGKTWIADGYMPYFWYMLGGQTWLEVDLITETGWNADIGRYLGRYTFWIRDWKWRIISESLDLINDVVTCKILHVS